MCAESTETRNQTVAKAFRGENKKGKGKGEENVKGNCKTELGKLKTEKYLNNM